MVDTFYRFRIHDLFISKGHVHRHIAIEIIVGGSEVTEVLAHLEKGVLDGNLATLQRMVLVEISTMLPRAARVVVDMKGAVLGHREIKIMLGIERKLQERLGFPEKEKEQTKEKRRNRRGKLRRIMEIWTVLSRWRSLDGKSGRIDS